MRLGAWKILATSVVNAAYAYKCVGDGSLPMEEREIVCKNDGKGGVGCCADDPACLPGIEKFIDEYNVVATDGACVSNQAGRCKWEKALVVS